MEPQNNPNTNVMAQIEEGDKVELTHIPSGNVYQFTVQDKDRVPGWAPVLHTNDGRSFTVRQDHSLRILKKRAPKVGDKITGPEVFDLPPGSVVISENGYLWVRAINRSQRLVVIGATDTSRIHTSFHIDYAYYTVKYIPE